MLNHSFDPAQLVALAKFRHEYLLEDARRQREANHARCAKGERPLHWKRMRIGAGEMLIRLGKRLKGSSVEASSVTDVVWG